MSGTVDSLVEMGFDKRAAELAVSKTGSDNIETVIEWIISHESEVQNLQDESLQQTPLNAEVNENPQPESLDKQVVKSIKCEDCGKLFQSQAEVDFHATKSGHVNFSESTEEKKALSEDEKREQLAKIEAKLKQKRLEREAREKQEALDREKNRIKSGKEMLEAKKKYDEIEMKKIIEQRKREKEDEKLARQRVRDQIEQDKLARKAKFSGQPQTILPPPTTPVVTARPAQTYSEITIQIRLTNGNALVQTFGAKEPLSAVRLFVEMNRKDEAGPFSLMTNYPKKVFGPEDYDVPLETLGLGPRVTLIVSKS